MKQYFSYFKWLFIVTAVLGVLYVGDIILNSTSSSMERQNTECLTEERVFDHGDVLTDEEENQLRRLIAEKEKQIQCDIVLVTLNESLKEYAREIEPDVSYDQFVRVYAENFYDDNKFGYNMPIGDGALLVDNWFREDDGKIYTWFCTTGKVKDSYDSRMTDRLLDRVYDYVENDPYKAYEAYVNEITRSMSDDVYINSELPLWWYFIALPTVVTFIYLLVHLIHRKGKKTTTATTYVSGGKAFTKHKEDVFIKKAVTSRRIERNDNSSSGGSSSSGGGGGGGSHGGGGRSR